MLLTKFVLVFPLLILMNFNYVDAVDVPKTPQWVLDVHEFWIQDKISDKEFSLMLEYIENRGSLNLVFDKDYDTISNFLLTIKQNQFSEQDFSCSDNWYITGYFLPLENDYEGNLLSISINDQTREFREDFVNTIKIEGWGSTIAGDYLGWYDESFHISQKPLDMDGAKLHVGKIAVDNGIIPHDSLIMIPTLPEPWNNVLFIASDEGYGISGKHVDVYTGEGKTAEHETRLITDYGNEVCILD